MADKPGVKSLAKGFALVMILCVCMGSDCKLPGSKKGLKVTKVYSYQVLILRTKESEGIQLAEYRKVRLLGLGLPPLDKPEIVNQLNRELNSLVDTFVILEYDVPGRPDQTDQEEILGYVFQDGKMINAELLRKGLGRFNGSWGVSRYVDLLKQAEEEARQAKRGMWADLADNE